MRLFTPIGAFPLIANNPCYHVGMFICTLVIYICDETEAADNEEFECKSKIKQN